MSRDSLAAALRSLPSEHPDRIGEGIEYLRAHEGSLPEAEEAPRYLEGAT